MKRWHHSQPHVRLALALMAMLAATGLVAGCATTQAQEAESLDSITYLEPQFFSTLYPPSAGFYPNGAVVNNITDRLLYQDPDTLELSPWIATDLPEVNEDASEYTFHLRDGVTYSDGTPLDAENVLRNIDLYARGDKERTLTSSEQIANYDHGEVVDDHTVRFYFSAPAPGFAQAMSSYNAGLLANSTLELANEGFAPGNAHLIIGSGPFYIADEVQGTKLILRAREDYDWAPPVRKHQGRARLDEIRYILAGEESVRVGALVAGQADVARQIEAPEEQHLIDRGINVVSHGTNGVTNQWAFRFRHPILSDIRVRQAIIHGVDREEILHTLYSASYPLAKAPLSQTALGFKDESAAYTYDPDQSRRLLDEAGWIPGPDGIRVKDGTRLSLTVNESLPLPRSRELTTKAQEQLRRIGVEINLNSGDYATQESDSLDANKIQIAHTVVGRADYDVIRSQYHSTTRNKLLNYDSHDGSIADTKLENLLDRVSASATEKERERWTWAVQDYLTENALVLPFFDEPQVYGVAPRVHGFQPEAVARPSFYEAWIDHDEERS